MTPADADVAADIQSIDLHRSALPREEIKETESHYPNWQCNCPILLFFSLMAVVLFEVQTVTTMTVKKLVVKGHSSSTVLSVQFRFG